MPGKRLLLVMLLLTASLVRGQQPNPPHSPRFDQGTVTNNTYSNDCLGFSYPIPESWQINSDALGAPLGGAKHVGTSGLLLLIVDQHTGMSVRNRIVVGAVDAKGMTLDTAAFVNQSVSRQISNTNEAGTHQLVKAAFPVELAGQPFFRSDFKTITPDITLYKAVIGKKFRGFFLAWTVVSPSPQGLDQGVASLQHLVFQPDQPNPSCLLGPDPAPPETALPERVPVSQGVSLGLLIRKVQPHYPDDARQNRIQGTVVLKALIDAEGNVEQLDLVSGHPMLAPAAINAVKKWKYKPYLLDGKAVKVETQILVIFALQAR